MEVAESNREDNYMHTDPQHYIDAMRLAVEGAGNDASELFVLRELLDMAPEGDLNATVSPRLLVAAIRNSGATISVG